MSVQATPTFCVLYGFFWDNPEEELTTQDAATKCRTTQKMARYTLQRMSKVGLVSMRKERNPAGRDALWIASAGPELLRMKGA